MLDWSGSPPLEQVYCLSLLLLSPSMRLFVRLSLSLHLSVSVSPSLCLSISLSVSLALARASARTCSWSALWCACMYLSKYTKIFHLSYCRAMHVT